MMGYGWGLGMGGWGWLGLLLIVALVVAGLVLLVRALSDGGRPGSEGGADRAVNIARERYARGELTREQFEALKSDLGG